MINDYCGKFQEKRMCLRTSQSHNLFFKILKNTLWIFSGLRKLFFRWQKKEKKKKAIVCLFWTVAEGWWMKWTFSWHLINYSSKMKRATALIRNKKRAALKEMRKNKNCLKLPPSPWLRWLVPFITLLSQKKFLLIARTWQGFPTNIVALFFYFKPSERFG